MRYLTEPNVTVLIITYRRPHTLRLVLEGLKRQSYRDFELVVVIKEPCDEANKLLEDYGRVYCLNVVIQKSGFAPEAFDMGIEVARGQIIVFLDDDAVPESNWLEAHVKTYDEHEGLGGVAGNDILAKIASDGSLVPLPELTVSSTKLYLDWMKHNYISRPLRRMSNWLTFFGRDGLVHHNPKALLKDELKESVPSLLFLGANMSVKKEAIKGFRLSESLTVTSFLFEQHLSYPILQRGYNIIYNPDPKVWHIVHPESLGRFFQKPISAAIRDAEYILSFYAIKQFEPEVSWMSYITELSLLIVGRFLGARKYGFKISIYRIYGLLYGFIIGALEDKKAVRNSLVKMFKSK